MALCTSVSRWVPTETTSSIVWSAHAHRDGAGPHKRLDERDVLGGIDRRGIDFEIERAAEGALDFVSATTLTR